MIDKRVISRDDGKVFNAICERYKAAFPNADPPPDFFCVELSFVPFLYDPFFDGLEKAIKTGKPIKNWDRVMIDRPMEPGAVA